MKSLSPIVGLGLCTLASHTPAADTNWTNSGTGSWEVDANWSAGSPGAVSPPVADGDLDSFPNAYIANGGTAEIISPTITNAANAIYLGNFFTGDGRVRSLTDTSLYANFMFLGDAGRTASFSQQGSVRLFDDLAIATYNLSGAPQNFSATHEMASAGANLRANRVLVGGAGSGLFNQQFFNNTEVYVEDALLISGIESGSGTTGSGEYRIGNSGALDTHQLTLQDDASFLQTGGTVDVHIGDRTGLVSPGVLSVSSTTTAESLYQLDDGTLNTERVEVGRTGTGRFSQSGGTHTTDTLQIGPLGTAGVPDTGVYELAGGELSATTAIINNGALNISGGEITGTGTGGLQNNGNLNITGDTTITGPVSIGAGGTIKVTDATVNWSDPLTINGGGYISDPSDNYFDDLIIEGDGYLVGETGDNFFVSGDFLNRSTQVALWDTADAYLGFIGTGDHSYEVENSILSEDLSFDTIELLDAGTLTFVGDGTTELYVNNLVLGAGSQLILAGVDVVYSGSFVNDSGNDVGGTGSIQAAPSPGTIMLMAAAFAGLTAGTRFRPQRS